MPYTRTIEQTVYTLEDLKTNEALKQKVLENLKDINIEFGLLDTDYCQGILKHINGKTYTDLHYELDHGAYCSFDWGISSSEFSEFIQNSERLTSDFGSKDIAEMVNRWKNEYDDINKWAKYCCKKDMMHAYASISHGHRSEEISYEYDFHGRSNLDDAFQGYAELLEEVCQDLSNYFLKVLRADFEHLTSEEAILETIHVNGYEFDEDGNII